MRIVHAMRNTGGVPTLLAQAQRSAGHQVSALLYPDSGGPPPGTIDLTRLLNGNALTRKARRARLVYWLATECDLLHFHFHGSFLRHYRDLALFKGLGKRIVFHLHGCDIRDPRRVRSERAVSACAECPEQCLTQVKLELPEAIRRYADAVIVATPDLLDFVPRATYIPNPVQLGPWQELRKQAYSGHARTGRWVVVHAPTHRAIKGTRHIEAAVARLQTEGMPVDLRLLERLSPAALRQACLDADVAIDQVLVGWIGIFAVEMMAAGKPVVAYIRPDLCNVQPTPPVISSEPEHLATRLKMLLQSDSMYRQYATNSANYAQEAHSIAAATKRVQDVYDSLSE